MDIISSISSGAVGGLLGGIGTLAKDIREAIIGKEMTPELQVQLQQKLLDVEFQTIQAQTKINEIEASSEHLFVAGWRPFVGWICGLSLAYAAMIEPLMCWIARVYGYGGTFPTLNTDITMQVLFGMLGIGIMRSYDKAQAPKPKGIE